MDVKNRCVDADEMKDGITEDYDHWVRRDLLVVDLSWDQLLEKVIASICRKAALRSMGINRCYDSLGGSVDHCSRSRGSAGATEGQGCTATMAAVVARREMWVVVWQRADDTTARIVIAVVLLGIVITR
ncbi:hypothetical protein BHE74_00040088 [Ensete ventricosum]|nr:hypothetical protein BHE74_00040088 [Ensete ventricosum]